MTPHLDTEQMSAYLDGEVPGSERATLERHLASCPDCTARKAALEGVVRSLKALPPPILTEIEAQSLRRVVRKDLGAGPAPGAEGGFARRTPARGTLWRFVAAGAAVAAVLIGIAVVSVAKLGSPSAHPTAASAPQHSVFASPSPAPAALGTQADVQAYARTLPGVSSFLQQLAPRPEPAPAGTAPQALGPAAAGTAKSGATGTAQSGATGVRVPAANVAPQPPPTLASCTLDAVPSGAALLGASAVAYQGTPAWLIAYATPSTSGGPLNVVNLEVRSQAACALLTSTTITP